MLDRKNLIFILVSGAIFMDMMVYSLVIPVLPSYSLKLGADTVTIGIIFGAFSVSLLLFSIPFGLISDSIGRRQFMILGMFLLAMTNLIFAVSDNVYVLIAARLLQGMSGAATWSAGLALLADTFEPAERGERLGMAMSVMSVGTLLGPMVGGILYDHLGYAPTFMVPSIMACAIGVMFILVNSPSMPVTASRHDHLGPIFKKPYVFLACCIAVIFGAATYGLLEPYMPVYLFKTFSATPTTIGIIFGAMSMLSVVAQPVIGKLYDSGNGHWLISAGLICSAAVIVTSALMPSLVLTGAVFALLGATMGFALTPMLPLLSDLYGGDGASNSRGLVYGVYNTLFSLGLAVGPFAGGLLISRFTFPLTLFGHALLLVVVGVVAYVFIKQPKKP